MLSSQEAPSGAANEAEHEAESTWSTGSYFRANLAGSVVALGFGVSIIVASREYALTVDNLPGPGLYPLVIGIMMTTLSATWLVGTLRGRHAPGQDTGTPPEKGALLRSGLALLAITAFVLALAPLGYPVSSAILVALLTLLARGGARKALVAGPAFAIGSYLVISSGLGVPLGLGILEPLLR